ncbi:hypothetical protein PspLS_02724 [Pyricularia sp. CBS 133598]|nr:hypothetical protein PspLS_02724 [Pyricularia sp. CBS 133598]
MPLSTYIFDAPAHTHLTPYLAALHGTCITHDHLIDAFLPPLNNDKLLGWWKSKIADANLVIIILLNESEPGTRAKGHELVGAALLRIPEAETSPFRAVVDNILVLPRFRRQGGARTLIDALQSQAIVLGKNMLTAEAESGSVGEQVLKNFGFREVGRIPNYAISPADHTKRDQTILCKDLLTS